MSNPCAVIFCRTRGRGSRLADPPWSLLTSLSWHNPQRLLCCLGQNFDQHICRDSWISVWHLAGLCWTSNTGYESQTAPCKVRLTGLRAIKEACVVFKGQNFSFIPSSPPDTLSVYFSFCPKPSLFISHILEISFLSFILTVLFFPHSFSEEASKIWKESDIYIDNVPAGLANVWKRPHALGTNFSLIGVKHFNDWGDCLVKAFFLYSVWY